MNAEAEIHMYKTEYLESRQLHISMVSTLQPTRYLAIVANLNICFIDIVIGVDSKQVYQNLETCRCHIQSLSGFQQATTSGFLDVALAELYLRDGNHSAANATFSAYVTSPKHGFSIFRMLECLERLADLSTGMNNFQNTLRWAAIFISLGLTSKTKLDTMKALHCLGQLLAAERDDDSALSLFTVALEGFTFMDVHRWRADCMAQIADIYEKRGEIQKSLGLWKMARPLFERSSQAKDVTRLDMRLAEADLALAVMHEQ
jgi:tetratricopeptide (TPR) repeat protein